MDKEETKKKKTTKVNAKTTKKETKPKKEVTKKKTTKDKEVNAKIEKEVIKETKKDEVLLDKGSQKAVRTLSLVISILAKIGRIILMIVVPFIVLFMIAIPFVMKHFEARDNVIIFYDTTVTINENNMVVNTNDKIEVIDKDYRELVKFTDFLTHNSKTDIIIITEVSISFVVSMLIISIYIFMYVEKLFYNIYSEKTPFTEKNTKLIGRICQMMILFLVVSYVFGAMLGIFLPNIKSHGNNSFGIFEILIVCTLYYIFKYATNLQKTSSGKMYE